MLDFVSDVQTGKITAENRIHDADIKDMQLSKDGTHFITASGDRTSKLVDSQDLQVMKEFAFERPANAAAMSPIADHVSHTPYALNVSCPIPPIYTFCCIDNLALCTFMLLFLRVEQLRAFTRSHCLWDNHAATTGQFLSAATGQSLNCCNLKELWAKDTYMYAGGCWGWSGGVTGDHYSRKGWQI